MKNSLMIGVLIGTVTTVAVFNKSKCKALLQKLKK